MFVCVCFLLIKPFFIGSLNFTQQRQDWKPRWRRAETFSPFKQMLQKILIVLDIWNKCLLQLGFKMNHWHIANLFHDFPISSFTLKRQLGPTQLDEVLWSLADQEDLARFKCSICQVPFLSPRVQGRRKKLRTCWSKYVRCQQTH